MTKGVGEIIKERREALHMSKSVLARQLGCSPQNVDSLEKRKSIDFEQAQKIAEILDFDIFAFYQSHGVDEQVKVKKLERKLLEISNKYTLLLEKHTQLLERLTNIK